MTTSATIAVTGATGRLGGRVARALAAEGRPQRLVVRRPEAAPALPLSEVASASYGDSAASREALRGVETLFMVSGSESIDRVSQHLSFVDAATEAGVAHVVYTSFYAAAPDAVFTLARDHWSTEEHIRASGMRWTFLRDNVYLDFMPMLAGPDGVIRGPAGAGRVSAVAQDDIADVALAVLLNPERHVCRTYDLTGPEELAMAEVAAILTAATGRVVSYHDETPEEAFASRASYGAPDWLVEAWVSTYLAIAAGQQAGLSDCVEQITGHRPVGLRDLLARP
jgi:uncharacterized protein YbjT (DUF2867 family)